MPGARFVAALLVVERNAQWYCGTWKIRDHPQFDIRNHEDTTLQRETVRISPHMFLCTFPAFKFDKQCTCNRVQLRGV